MKVFAVGERYVDISGPLRDEFVTELVRMRDAGADDIVVDFSGVEAISSIALAAVGRLHTWMEERDRKLVVRGLSPRLRQLFEITGLADVLHIEPAEGGEAAPSGEA